MSPGRALVVAEARRWLGTPYQHQASLKGVGCDCLGLVRGVWRAVVGEEPEPIPPYGVGWAVAGGEELLLGAARRWFDEAPQGEPEPGDLLVFRMSPAAAVRHAAIMTEDGASGRMIHAYWCRTVVENALGPWWRERLAAVFRFPGVN